MSNSNTAARDNRELMLYLGTYWFDFEQAAELGDAVLTAKAETRQDKPSEEQAHNYVI